MTIKNNTPAATLTVGNTPAPLTEGKATAVKAAAAMASTPDPAPLFRRPIPLEVRYVTMTYAEYVDTEKLIPVFQRPAVWSEAWKDALADSIMRGYPLPALILCEVVNPDGATTLLIIDGVQRTTCMEAIHKELDNAPEGTPAAEMCEWLEDYPLTAMVVRVPDLRTAAALFVRYNSGNRLSAVQKGRAMLPDDVLAKTAPWADVVKLAKISKFGRMDADTLSAIVAAAALTIKTPGMAFKATTTATASIKMLTKAEPEAIPAPEVYPAFSAVFEALTVLPADTVTNWAVSARLIPLCLAFATTRPEVTTAEVVDFVSHIALEGNRSKARCSFKKGKAITSKTMTINEAFGRDHNGSGPRDTAIHTTAFVALIKGYFDNTPEGGEPLPGMTPEAAAAEAEAAAAAEAALTAMMA